MMAPMLRATASGRGRPTARCNLARAASGRASATAVCIQASQSEMSSITLLRLSAPLPAASLGMIGGHFGHAEVGGHAQVGVPRERKWSTTAARCPVTVGEDIK